MLIMLLTVQKPHFWSKLLHNRCTL